MVRVLMTLFLIGILGVSVLSTNATSQTAYPGCSPRSNVYGLDTLWNENARVSSNSSDDDGESEDSEDEVRFAKANLHPINSSGVKARIEFTDDGVTLTVNGTAQGLDPESSYLTLIYDNGAISGGPKACLPTIFDPQDPDFLLGRMVVGSWDVDADGHGTLTAINTNSGADYVPIGKFRATSVRRVLGPPPTPGAPPPTDLEACGHVAIEDEE